ncbi:phosphate acetyltransferase [Pseudogracilibacillus auburnensis]|uniref:Phosphate acetyltransferase n=1 Tax=Pseudogracilibacillus auburnensis TaxID=1494959 RepID=A0A2V3W0W4_9BACI|nr:phosphate acetyltransferase [Pseudogracilibacillus auburnensis]MBO1002092.1 phosphate acetyltransferase [Pseudogracilibacillus auburnensis]PXW87416.1 phosphotransacetylase [Pseudogracilibacillus auburnensis]
MSDLFTGLKQSLREKTRKKIVFPEATDERILTAASRLAKEELVAPVLIGKVNEVNELAKRLNVDIDSCDITDPNTYEHFDELVDAFIERRNGRVSKEDAQHVLRDENYFGTMLVHLNKADGLVSGAAHSTSDTVRPALQIIKTKEGVSKTSGVFIMVRDEEKYVFADCAINIAPTSDDLAEIAIESARTATLFDVDPRIAMLSFSTKGSAKSAETERVIEAVKIAKEKDASLLIDGEFQFDTAFVPSVAAKKAPNSDIKGDATVFVFPSLEAGNIGYKITERLGGFEAVGPILQGLNKPVNDLSRGCSEEDVYKLALITAAQVE